MFSVVLGTRNDLCDTAVASTSSISTQAHEFHRSRHLYDIIFSQGRRDHQVAPVRLAQREASVYPAGTPLVRLFYFLFYCGELEGEGRSLRARRKVDTPEGGDGHVYGGGFKMVSRDGDATSFTDIGKRSDHHGVLLQETGG